MELLAGARSSVKGEAFKAAAFATVLQWIDVDGQFLSNFDEILVPAFARKHACRRQFDQPLIRLVLRTNDLQCDPAMRIGPFELLYGTFQRDSLCDIKQGE